MKNARTVDVHAHVVPESCTALVTGKAESQNFIGDMTDLDRRLRDMDAWQVDVQVISAWQGFFNQPLSIAQQFNTAIADYAARQPDRVAALGIVPLGQPETAAAEVERCIREVGLKGVAIGSNVNGRALDEPEFADFFAAAEELECPIFIHPTNPLGIDRLRQFELVNLLGFVTDTACAAARLALSGTLARYPGLKIHLAHGGGATAMLAGRWDHGWRERPSAGGTPSPPSAYLRRLHVDSILHGDDALNLALGFWGHEHVMMGTDYPYDMGMPNAVDWISRCAAEPDRAAVLATNAIRFFNLA